jgi:hypothetical protein
MLNTVLIILIKKALKVLNQILIETDVEIVYHLIGDSVVR